VSEDTEGTRLLDALGVVILGGVNDLAIVNDESETARSLPQVPADAARELGIVIGHEELRELAVYFKLRIFRTCNSVISNTVGLGPTMHNEGIVDSNYDDLVNALGLDLINVLDVRRNMRATTGGGESTRDGDKDNLLVLELCSSVSVWIIWHKRSHTLASVVVGRGTAGREFGDFR
jgi:hypothetical protein